MANKAIPTSPNNECPICADVSGKCRFIDSSDGEFILCWTNSGARLLEIINGHRCVKEARGENWATFAPTSNATVNHEELDRKRQERELAKAREREELAKGALPIEDRDRAIRRLHAHFGLSLRHSEDLQHRGLSNSQIDHLLYFTITPNQEIPFGIPANLPGVKDGQIKAAGSGYACITFDPRNRATGWQIRLDDATDNKYRWAKGERPSHLSNGELPITSVYPSEIKHSGIWACEGISKPAIAANRLGIVALGAASANFTASPQQSEEHLKKAAEFLKTQEIIFAPDGGAVSNPNVLSAYKRSWELFNNLGYQVKVAWWGQVDKSHPDVDELDDLGKIDFISCEDFLWVAKEEIGKSASAKLSPKVLPQKIFIPSQPTSNDKSQKRGNLPSKATNQESLLSLQSTTFDILNPPLIVSSPIQSLKDGISKVLPIPESVASLWTTEEEKAPRKERRWFESVLKRIKKVLLKSDKRPRLGFNCFKEDNPEFEEKIRRVQRKLRSLSYDADIESHQRYLPNELATQLPKSGLIGIKAPKGCGKSVLLKKIIAIAKKQGIPVLSITPRIALGREQAIKWEITWIDDYGTMQTRAGDTAQQIEEVAKKRSEAREKLTELESIHHQQLNLLGESETLKLEQQKADLRIEIERYGEEIENINAASIKTLALCWDSLWRTKDRDLKESLIIIDEAELGFKHFITGSTCKRNRPYLLQTFKDKLSECLMSGGRVILSDADLTDLPINYVRDVLPIPIKPFIVTNEYIGEETRWMVDFRTGSRGNTLTDIINAIKKGAYLAITTDSQAEAQALEKLILQDFPDEFCAFLDEDGNITDEAQARQKALIVRIDRTTTESEAGKKFIQKPNEQILHWKPRVLIYTPSMGVGVSIDESTQRWNADWEEMVPYFDTVYGLFFGVIEPSQCRQQLARVRANVLRIVYAKESNRALEGCASFFPDEVKRQTLKYNHSALNILDIARGIAGFEADDEQIREEMLKLLTESWDKDSRCWKEPSIDLASAFKARENYGLWNLANLLREELEDEGHSVISLEGMKTDLVEEMAEIKDDQKMKEAILIAEAPLMPIEEARKTIYKLGETKERYRSAQKSLLQEELPEVNLTPEFVKKAVVDDRRRWLNQQRLFWYFKNSEAVKQIDTDQWLNNLKKFAETMPFMRDIRSHSPKVEALRESGIFDFVQVQGEEIADHIYQGNSPEAEAFLKRCLENKDSLQTALNVLVTKKSSPIGLANRILGKVGLELSKVSRSNKCNKWQLNVNLVNDPDRANVLKAFELRWQMSQEEAAQKIAEKQALIQPHQTIQPGGEVASYIDTNQSSPPIAEEVSQGVSEHSLLGGDAAAAAVYSELQKLPQINSHQAIQPGGEVASYIDTNQSSPPIAEEVSQGVGQPTEAIALQADPVAELVEAFPYCDTSQTFAAVIEQYSHEAVEAAIALQPNPLRQQLREWFAQLSHPEKTAGAKLAHSNQDISERPPLTAYRPGEIVWAFFPQAGDKWRKATVEWVRANMVRVVSGFFGMLIEHPNMIAPGDWEFG
jgi:hypothetical protein